MRSVIACLFFFLLLFPGPRAGGQEPEGAPGGFHDDMDRPSLERAVRRSLDFLARLSPDRVVGERPRRFTAGEIRESLLSFLDLLDLWKRPEEFAREVRARFDLYPVRAVAGEVLLTGYYRPVVAASLVETAQYCFPIYRKPDDLLEAAPGAFPAALPGEKIVGRLEGGRLVPYFSRGEIDGLGRLKGKGYEIAWVKDPVDLFFLHIQGSGILRLEDGRLLQVNYAASNGRPYTSIGKLLVDRGAIPRDEVSMQSLRRYLREHPGERDALLAENESYIFFRFVDDGPLGSLDVPLTPGRSIAADARLFPKGVLAFVASSKPDIGLDRRLSRWRSFSRFVLSQDAGSAIRGPGRVDLYFGSGEEAGLAAGLMKSDAKIYFLVRKRDGADKSKD